MKKKNAREVVIEVEITQEGFKDLSMEERRIPTLELIIEEVLPLNPMREHSQNEVTMLGKYKNKNGKRNS